MKREPIVRHDDDSITIEGDGREFLQHLSDHQKGKGDDEEHCEIFGHNEMHSIPHNQSPFERSGMGGSDYNPSTGRGTNYLNPFLSDVKKVASAVKRAVTGGPKLPKPGPM